MDKIDLNYWLVMLGLMLIVVEVVVGAASGFELLLIGVIFMLSGGVGLFSGSFTISLVLAASLIFAYLFFGRRMIRKSLHIGTKNTNVDSLMGRTAVVVKKITPLHAGQVKIDGEVWRAESDKELAAGDKTKIISVSGVTLKVA